MEEAAIFNFMMEWEIGLKLKITKTFPFRNTIMKCFVVPEFTYFVCLF